MKRQSLWKSSWVLQNGANNNDIHLGLFLFVSFLFLPSTWIFLLKRIPFLSSFLLFLFSHLPRSFLICKANWISENQKNGRRIKHEGKLHLCWVGHWHNRNASYRWGKFIELNWAACGFNLTNPSDHLPQIVNIAAYRPDAQYSQHIMPLMNLNPGARQRHQIRVINVGCFRMLKSMQTYKVKHVHITKSRKFLIFIVLCLLLFHFVGHQNENWNRSTPRVPRLVRENQHKGWNHFCLPRQAQVHALHGHRGYEEVSPHGSIREDCQVLRQWLRPCIW